ncbi:hypothetical protein L1887_21001 [Cichorium endivia]|nr:hypothetical protein L1887_21001 [Cichorium endivia]
MTKHLVSDVDVPCFISMVCLNSMIIDHVKIHLILFFNERLDHGGATTNHLRLHEPRLRGICKMCDPTPDLVRTTVAHLHLGQLSCSYQVSWWQGQHHICHFHDLCLHECRMFLLGQRFCPDCTGVSVPCACIPFQP